MAKRDYYEVLGIDKVATADDIKKAYRKLAIQFHPDKTAGDKAAEEKFKEATEAYEILSDPQKKSRYDQFGFAGVDPSAGGGQAAYRDFEDLFGGGAFGDIFGSFFGGGGGRRESTPRGSDLRYDLELEFADAAFGKKVELSYTHSVGCSTCSGTGAEAGSKRKVCATCQGQGQVRRSSGFFSIAQTCPTCNGDGHTIEKPCKSCRGSGTERKKNSYVVQIPAGIENGKRIRIESQGDAGPNGGVAGDLYVYMHIKDHEYFERNGNDLYCLVPVSFTQAALGSEINVATLDGKKIRLKIPAGTQNNKLFRVKEAGIPFLHTPQRKGDLFIKVHVEVPQNLNTKAKDLMSQLAKLLGEEDSPRPVKLSSIE